MDFSLLIEKVKLSLYVYFYRPRNSKNSIFYGVFIIFFFYKQTCHQDLEICEIIICKKYYQMKMHIQ